MKYRMKFIGYRDGKELWRGTGIDPSGGPTFLEGIEMMRWPIQAPVFIEPHPTYRGFFMSPDHGQA